MAKAMVDNLNPVPLYARILSPNSFSNFRSFGAINDHGDTLIKRRGNNEHKLLPYRHRLHIVDGNLER